MCLSTLAIKLNSVLVQTMWVFSKTIIHTRTHAHTHTHTHTHTNTHTDGQVTFTSSSLLITITCNKKYFATVTYYIESKVTVIILHIILLLKATQQFSNNVSYSYHIEANFANEQHFT